MEKWIFPIFGLFASAGIFAFALGLPSAFATGCPDFSGTFTRSGDAGRTIKLTVEQSACDRADATYDYGDGIRFSRPMVFDGIKRTILSRNGLRVAEAFRWISGEIQVSKETSLDGSSRPILGRSRIYLDSSRNLVEEPIGPNSGQNPDETTIYFRN